MATLTAQQSQERQSVLAVIALTIVALLLGWLLKGSLNNQSRTISQNGFSAEIPASWLAQGGNSELRLVVKNPSSFDERYHILQVPAESDLGAAAARQNNDRLLRDKTYRVLVEESVTFNDQPAYRVSYAFVKDRNNDLPQIVEGVAYYVPAGNSLLIISYEADHDDFAAGLPAFTRFLQSVSQTNGG